MLTSKFYEILSNLVLVYKEFLLYMIMKNSFNHFISFKYIFHTLLSLCLAVKCDLVFRKTMKCIKVELIEENIRIEKKVALKNDKL